MKNHDTQMDSTQCISGDETYDDFKIRKPIDSDYLNVAIEPIKSCGRAVPDSRLRRALLPDIDYSPSSGATDPKHATQDQSTDLITGRYGWMNKQTSIGGDLKVLQHSEDGDSLEYRPLNETNRNMLSGSEDTHQEQLRRDHDRERQLEAWGDQIIGLSDFEIERAKYLLSKVPDEKRQGNGDDVAILAALKYAANEDRGPEKQKILNSTKGQKIEGSEVDTDRFFFREDMAKAYEKIRDGQDITSTEIGNVRDAIRERL